MNAVQTPPATSGDPLEKEGVQELDFWGLICDLVTVLGNLPLESIVWRYELGRFSFILNVTGEMVDLSEARMLGILECRVLYYPPKAGSIGQIVMRVSPWECQFCESGYDYSVLAKVIEEEIERLLELDKAEL
jgi:hypothetical protein